MALQQDGQQGPVAAANVQHGRRVWQCQVMKPIRTLNRRYGVACDPGRNWRVPRASHVFPKWDAMNMLVGGPTSADTRKQAMKDCLVHPTPHAPLVKPRPPRGGVGICEEPSGRGDPNELIAGDLYYSPGLEHAQQAFEGVSIDFARGGECTYVGDPGENPIDHTKRRRDLDSETRYKVAVDGLKENCLLRRHRCWQRDPADWRTVTRSQRPNLDRLVRAVSWAELYDARRRSMGGRPAIMPALFRGRFWLLGRATAETSLRSRRYGTFSERQRTVPQRSMKTSSVP